MQRWARRPEKKYGSGVKKTGNSFAEIGIDFWSGLEVRANKSLDSPYDFGNWLTVGAFDASEIRAALSNNVTFRYEKGSNGWSVSYNDIRDIFEETQNSFRNNQKKMKVYRE
ncbi:hypothetical protein [Paenibacillus popilliae]|uniref:Uncharacterized protein n=1 Tax=Paenibacillus popilliae TaxID=78057 RepID=A0ABY3AI01_PAEPP|nr:hypothetical protein [Paenibacillus sp. SDF0028]TQR41459.1 hypothetical protein C7Y44_25940 [Paenibacillus sp. SDF0028]